MYGSGKFNEQFLRMWQAEGFPGYLMTDEEGKRGSDEREGDDG